MSATIRGIGGTLIRQLLPMSEAITRISDAMISVSNGETIAPQRWAMAIEESSALGFMPGAMPGLERMGLKLVSLFPANADMGLPTHQGVFVLLNSSDGRPLCVLDSHVLTALRTAAATAAATAALAREDAEICAFLGAGEQAEWHVEALSLVRPFREIRIWSRSADRARALADRVADKSNAKVVALPSPLEAVRGADVISTVSSARTPILMGEWLNPGQHVNLVGSSTAKEREADDLVVGRGRFFVDSRPNALAQAGELRSAIHNGLVSDGHIEGEIGEILAGRHAGRAADGEITIFKSLGHVAQDIAAASAVYQAAERLDCGTAIPW